MNHDHSPRGSRPAEHGARAERSVGGWQTAERVARWGLVLVVLSGCTTSEEARPYHPVADVQELMLHVVEPAAQTYWGAVGWIVDFDGELYIHPTSDEEWLAVENAAFMVAESGNLLMMADRALDDEGWMAMSRSLIDVGERALRAAEAMDEQGVFDLGAEMYFVCSNCHAAYSPEILRPNDDRSTEAEPVASSSGGPGEGPR
ncbi:MAG: hypothetical protein OEN56_08855 [Gemmatimonadota bacterium]|nr:hypothetical protein [Gemmatimonadota bacterium]